MVIADDHPIVRQGIRGILSGCEDIEVVGEVDDGAALEALCERLRPDVLLLDISMPGPGFFELLRNLELGAGGPAVLVFSMHAEATYAWQAIKAGARGYLSKPRSPELLPEAIRVVAAGEIFPSECGKPGREGAFRSVDVDPLNLHSQLSPREFEVFLLLGEGMRVADIAARLGISPKTVSTHRTRILEKTRLGGNAAIVRYVASRGLLD